MSSIRNVKELFDLTGRVFIVVGGVRNLGHDISTALAQAGANGIITSRDKPAADSAAYALSERTGKTIIGLQLDATREDAVKEFCMAVQGRFGRIDILVNNVGGGASAGNSPVFEERSLDSWNKTHEANLTAPFLICKHVVPMMKKQRSGSIINIASIAGIVGRDRRVYPHDMRPQAVDYASAKAGIIGFTRDLAAYVGPDGIRVNAISPGGFERGQPQVFVDSYSAKVPLKRMGKDGVDLKGAALFLASEASAYVTGHNLVVDGGFTVWQ